MHEPGQECPRGCVDCGRCICSRPKDAYLCASDFDERQRDARKRYYEAHPKGRKRYTKTVGTEIVCATPECGAVFVKKSGNHRFCDPCRTANDSYHDTVWNSRNPNRPHGPALNGVWGTAA